MPAKRYIVRLSIDERDSLELLINRGRVAAARRLHTQILLLSDEGEHGPALIDAEVAEQLGVTARTVERTRIRCTTEGLEEAITRKPRSRERRRRLDGDAEAHLLKLACSEPPEGSARWTRRLLADRMIELDIVSTVACETVRQVLKKHHQTLAP